MGCSFTNCLDGSLLRAVRSFPAEVTLGPTSNKSETFRSRTAYRMASSFWDLPILNSRLNSTLEALDMPCMP